jgi:hypothetical protein
MNSVKEFVAGVPLTVIEGLEDDRPEIRYTTEAHEMVNAAEAALIERADGEVFQKAGVLVRIVTDGRPRKGHNRIANTPTLGVLPEDALVEMVGRHSAWSKFSRERKAWEPAAPHRGAVKMLAARPSWGFPHLEGVIESPTIRRDGTIVDRPGYDEDLRVFYRPNADFPSVAKHPTRSDAQAAVEMLKEPFLDFPTRDDSDRSALIAGLVTLVVRPAIDGVVPAFVVRKNAPGVGGSLAVDAISAMVYGRIAAKASMPAEAAELRKLLLSVAIAGDPMLLFDNLEGSIGSAVFSGAITAGEITDRILGGNKNPRVPLRAVFYITGNGLSFRRDMGRRVVLCDLVTEEEHPEDRTTFRHYPLLPFCESVRSDAVVAALTIVRAWVAAGSPPHGLPKKGGFEAWDDFVRAPLLWAGAADFRDTEKRVREDLDDDVAALRGALEVWSEAFSHPVTAADVIGATATNDSLRESICELCHAKPGELTANRLGYALRRVQDRPAGGKAFHLEAVKAHASKRLWSIKTLGK